MYALALISWCWLWWLMKLMLVVIVVLRGSSCCISRSAGDGGFSCDGVPKGKVFDNSLVE